MRGRLEINGEQVEVVVALGSDGAARIKLGEAEHEVQGVRLEDGRLSFTHGGRVYRFALLVKPQSVLLAGGGRYHSFARLEEGAALEEDRGADELTSQMPGTVLETLVEPGSEVAKGTPLLILEAMKMEHEVCAPQGGVVGGYPHAAGTRVMPGDLLVEFTPAAS